MRGSCPVCHPSWVVSLVLQNLVGTQWSSSGHTTCVFLFLNALFILASASTRRFGCSMLCLSVCLPRAPALRQVLVGVLAEGALESPSVLVLAFHSSLFLVGGSSDGSAPGDRFLSPGRMCLIHSVRLSSVASALSLSESWLFFLLWICRCYCRIQCRRPSRKLLRFP